MLRSLENREPVMWRRIKERPLDSGLYLVSYPGTPYPESVDVVEWDGKKWLSIDEIEWWRALPPSPIQEQQEDWGIS